jgi:hypothetical protein
VGMGICEQCRGTMQAEHGCAGCGWLQEEDDIDVSSNINHINNTACVYSPVVVGI